MKLLVVTQAVDEENPVLGFFCHWIAELAKRVEHIHVICLTEGVHHFPPNVAVHSLGKERGAQSRGAYAATFLTLAWRLRDEYDTVFVHMNAEYFAIAGWLWKLQGKRAVLWYNHPSNTVWLRIAGMFADIVFHTSPYAASAKFSHAVSMPAGIDTDIFTPAPAARDRHAFYIQGRITPSKRIDLALAALEVVRKSVPATLTLVGPEDPEYGKELRTRFASLIKDGAVNFAGPKKNEETPALYRAHGGAINLAAAGHFDKTALEPMACETPVVVTSPAFKGLVPDEWIVADTPEALGEALARLIGLPDAAYAALGAAERAAVVAHQSLAALMDDLARRLAILGA